MQIFSILFMENMYVTEYLALHLLAAVLKTFMVCGFVYFHCYWPSQVNLPPTSSPKFCIETVCRNQNVGQSFLLFFLCQKRIEWGSRKYWLFLRERNIVQTEKGTLSWNFFFSTMGHAMTTGSNIAKYANQLWKRPPFSCSIFFIYFQINIILSFGLKREIPDYLLFIFTIYLTLSFIMLFTSCFLLLIEFF